MVYRREGVKLYVPAGDCRDTPVRPRDRSTHPAYKPYLAMEWMLGLLPDGPVLDPLAGSGTTLRAARALGRRSVGIEREEEYCAEIVRMLQKTY